MMRRTIIFLLTLIFIAGSSEAQRRRKSPPKGDALTSLIGLVVEDEAAQEEQEIPESLAAVITAYYAEEVVDESVTEDVLAYVAGVYMDHDYYDIGVWAPTTPPPPEYPDYNYNYNNRANYNNYNYRSPGSSNPSTPNRASYSSYKPYKGELPKCDYSQFVMPVIGRLNSKFGYRPSFGRMHKGIDIGLKIGDPVKCVLPGVVTKVSYEAKGYGNYVVVTHAGDMETRYAHLDSTSVKAGDLVMPGSIVGLGGNTGNSTGPHLHFEIRYMGVAMDPITWFNIGNRFKK